MKDQLITQVEIGMSTIINDFQLLKLKEVLNNTFQNVSMIESENTEQIGVYENENLLENFISAKQIEGCSKKTLKYYNTTISNLLKNINKPIREISADDLRKYLADYQNTRNSSKVTIDNMRRIFSSFFGWLENEDYILKSPVRRIHKVKTDKLIKETFTDEHLELLRDSCTDIRDLALVDLLSSTGMRVGELVLLNRNDLNFQERECIVFGKGGTERSVYFDARTKLHLSKYLESRSDNNPALFVSLSNSNNRLLSGGVELRLNSIGKLAGMKKVHPHKFRRTLATRAIDKGMPIEQVQRLLGHVKIDTTMHYAMVNQVNVKNSHRKFVA
jgi:site-specific recombinase XerD